jgi:rod shape-determining protein MreD
MSRIAGSRREFALVGFRRQWVPVISILAASLLALFPYVATWPIVPDFAFLVLLAWRLLRPEMWQAHGALLLGLFNDLVAGLPVGQSVALWTLIFLLFDLVDSRVGWRDYWLDWLFAAMAILLYTAGGWYIAHLMHASAPFNVLLPQLALSIVAYPLVARLVVALDRWRLYR